MSQQQRENESPHHDMALDDVSEDNFTDDEQSGGICNRIVTKKGLELAQYVRDMYDSGARLWTKDMFRNIEAELAKEPQPKSVTIRSMNGELSSKAVPVDGINPDFDENMYLRMYVRFKPYRDLIEDAEEESIEPECDEDLGWYPRDISLEDRRTLASRALSLTRGGYLPTHIDSRFIKATWDEARHNWSQSRVCKELKATLSGLTYIPKAKRVVCFGLGRLDRNFDASGSDELAACDGLPRYRTMTQHSAALTLAAVLGERSGSGPLPVFVQDPDYSSEHREMLRDAGMEVVGGYGSLAFTYVDDETVVLTCAPGIPVRQIVADIARPAAMIWDPELSVGGEERGWEVEIVNGEKIYVPQRMTDEDSPRTRKMLEGYDKIEFPPSRERFGSLMIYVRRD
ncbi:hypothetical protein SCARD494_10707 [Seiridium cardinale]